MLSLCATVHDAMLGDALCFAALGAVVYRLKFIAEH